MTNDEPLHIKGKTDVQIGQVPTDDDLYWVGAMRTVFVDSMRSTHTSAIAILCASLLGWGLVAAMLLFGGHRAANYGLLVWIVPLFIWSVSIVWSLRVLSTRRYRYFSNSPDSAHQAIVRIARRKFRHLYTAVVVWAAGVVAFVLAFAYQLMAGQ
ncbi:MAG: hypothetical protein GF341_05795 [candidate division Zixibacteria bacterium]|nr:hypothetical protein [candidate division Zixibacteria bacterium]